MAASAQRTSELHLYASEDKSVDEKKVDIEVSNADCKFEGPQDFKLDFESYKFKKQQGASREYYDLEDRFVALETDTGVSVNAAAITALQARCNAATTWGSLSSADLINRAVSV